MAFRKSRRLRRNLRKKSRRNYRGGGLTNEDKIALRQSIVNNTMFPGGLGYIKRQKIINRLVAEEGFHPTTAAIEVDDAIKSISFNILGS